MNFFRVYRCFRWDTPELSRENYVLSIIVSDTSADYVISPVQQPERTLPFFRERLRRFVETFGEPDGVDGWYGLASFNLGRKEFKLVMEAKKEDGPLANFEEVVNREQQIVEDWFFLNIAPPSE